MQPRSRVAWILGGLALAMLAAVFLLRPNAREDSDRPGGSPSPTAAPGAAGGAGATDSAAGQPSPAATGPRTGTQQPAALSPSHSPPSTADSASAAPPTQRVERRLMGTVWAVVTSGGNPGAARAAGEKALDEVARLETVLSEWIPESDISRVNQAAGKQPVKVARELIECVQASLEIARYTEGAFDISWAVMRDLWDFGPNSRHVPPSREQVNARLPLWNWRNIRVDTAASTLFLVKKGMQIGVGGIAKGYAADRAGEIVLAAGYRDFLIFAGGQVLVHGRRGNRPWRVGIQHPRAGTYFGFVEVTDGSVATSGDYEHSYEYEGRRYHHIIDPRTGFPGDKSASVTVIAKNGLWADAIDTALFVLGPKRALAALARAPGGPYEAVLVDPELRLFTTEGMRKHLLLRAHIDHEHRIGAPLGPDEPNATLADAPP